MNTKTRKTITKLLGIFCIVAVSLPSFCEPGIRDWLRSRKSLRASVEAAEQAARQAQDAADRAIAAARKSTQEAARVGAKSGTQKRVRIGTESTKPASKTTSRPSKDYAVTKIAGRPTIRTVRSYLPEGSYASYEQLFTDATGSPVIASDAQKWLALGGTSRVFNNLDEAMALLTQYVKVTTPNRIEWLRKDFAFSDELPKGPGEYYAYELPEPIAYRIEENGKYVGSDVLTTDKYTLVQSVEGGPVFLIEKQDEAAMANPLRAPLPAEFAQLSPEEIDAMPPYKLFQVLSGGKTDFVVVHDLQAAIAKYIEHTNSKAVGVFRTEIGGETEEYLLYKVPTNIKLRETPKNSNYNPNPSYVTYTPDNSYILRSTIDWRNDARDPDAVWSSYWPPVNIATKEELQMLGGQVRLFEI